MSGLGLNTDSHEWLAVRNRCEMRIGECRENLDRQGYPTDKTEFERGRLTAFREIIGLPDEVEDPPLAMGDTYGG